MPNVCLSPVLSTTEQKNISAYMPVSSGKKTREKEAIVGHPGEKKTRENKDMGGHLCSMSEKPGRCLAKGGKNPYLL